MVRLCIVPHSSDSLMQAQLELRVWGLDNTGKPFSQAARTSAISYSGASLLSIFVPLDVGEVIGVQYGNQKARFRVVRAGQKGTVKEGEIGIACLEPNKCIWPEALATAQGANAAAEAGTETTEIVLPARETIPSTTTDAGQPERRRHLRYPCTGLAQLSRLDDQSGGTVTRLADISLGGCYIETSSPLAVETPVRMLVRLDDAEIRVRGIVRTCHPMLGNGIAFTHLPEADWKRLHLLITRLANAATAPPIPVPEADIPTTVQVLLDLLEQKGVLTRREYREELKLRRLRGVSEAANPPSGSRAEGRAVEGSDACDQPAPGFETPRV
jgi:hypothetical protein